MKKIIVLIFVVNMSLNLSPLLSIESTETSTLFTKIYHFDDCHELRYHFLNASAADATTVGNKILTMRGGNVIGTEKISQAIKLQDIEILQKEFSGNTSVNADVKYKNNILIKDIQALKHIKELSNVLNKLFSRYAFKGYTFAVMKPLTSFNSINFGIRIPITTNFPDYDRRSYLPRIGAFLELAFPLTVITSVSFSLTVGTVLIGATRVIRWSGLIPSKSIDKLTKRLKIKPTQNVRRIGFTIGIRINQKYGLRPYIGSWVLYLSNDRIPDTIISPISFSLAVLIVIINVIKNGDIQKSNSNNTSNNNNNNNNNNKIQKNHTSINQIDNNHDNIINNITMLQSDIAKYFALKFIGLGSNFGMYSTPLGAVIKGNAICDFYPFDIPLFLSLCNIINMMVTTIKLLFFHYYIMIRNLINIMGNSDALEIVNTRIPLDNDTIDMSFKPNQKRSNKDDFHKISIISNKEIKMDINSTEEINNNQNNHHHSNFNETEEERDNMDHTIEPTVFTESLLQTITYGNVT